MKMIKATGIRRILAITFLMNLGPNAMAQLSKPILDSLYANNDIEGLSTMFEELHQQTAEAYLEISNDSHIKIQQLFNSVFDLHSMDTNVKYFFLQLFGSRIDSETGYYIEASFLIGQSNNPKRRPIKHDKNLISAILDFVGPDPITSNALVREYLNSKEKMEPIKKLEAERIMSEYSSRLQFINRVVIVPGTWGKIIETLVPYRINSLKFNADMTEAEIDYSLPASGATEVYRLLDGNWIKHKTLISYIH